jgi:hypothetical protein
MDSGVRFREPNVLTNKAILGSGGKMFIRVVTPSSPPATLLS